MSEHRGAAVLQVDAGGLFDSRSPDRRAAELMWQAMGALGLDVLNLTPDDLAVLKRTGGEPHDTGGSPQTVTANVFGPGRRLLAPPYIVRRAPDRTRIVITGVSQPRAGGNFGYMVEDPRAALERLVPQVAGEGSMVVVLAYMSGRDAAGLAGIRGVDVIVSGFADQFAVPPYQVGDAWVLQAQFEGRFVGQAELRTQASRRDARIASHEIVVLDASFQDDPRMAALLANRVAEGRKTQ